MSYQPVEFMNCEGCGCRIGTFAHAPGSAYGEESRIYRTKYQREACPACGAILCITCARKALRRWARSRKPRHERAACYACTHGTHCPTRK